MTVVDLRPRTRIAGGRGAAASSLVEALRQGIAQPQAILVQMTNSVRRHLASSPFQPDPETPIERYALNDLVSHDSYGMGRVIQMEAAAVTVDFRSQIVRIKSPYSKMAKL